MHLPQAGGLRGARCCQLHPEVEEGAVGGWGFSVPPPAPSGRAGATLQSVQLSQMQPGGTKCRSEQSSTKARGSCSDPLDSFQ